VPPDPTLPERLHRAALTAYRYLPMPVRRMVIRMVSPPMTAGAAVVLRRSDGRILLVKQRHTGAWALPGGLVRRRELPPAAAAREVGEEVGIRLDGAQLGPSRIVFDPNRRALDFVFVHPADEQVARRNDAAEVTRFGWFDPGRLPDVTEPTVGMLRAAGIVRAGGAH
jgi:8-oxo-dGTP diphosphatase